MPAPNPVPERYEILEELTRGDFGVLLRARDKLLRREVILKLPPPGWFHGAQGGGAPTTAERERALREARALASVQHHGVVRLLDVVETEDGPLLVIEPVSGETLAERLQRERKLDPETVRTLGIAIAEALECVHGNGVIHRGIALDTIALREDGKPLITGFEFAKFGSSGGSMSSAGTTFLYKKGSGHAQVNVPLPPHPAPEQLAGQSADGRSDLFGLGWVLYECLTGEEPYSIEFDVEHWKTPRDPRMLAPSAPKPLCDAILKCLQTSPLKRFANAAALKSALATAAPAGSARAPAVSEQAPKRRAVKPIAIAAGILVAAAGTWGALQFGRKPAQAGGGDSAPTTRGVSAAPRPSLEQELGGKPIYAKLHAVIIGIETYDEWPTLHCAVKDAADVRKLLEDDFAFAPENVHVLLNKEATKTNIQNLIGELRDTGEEDGVIVFFAGHGATLDLGHGQLGYLVPVGGSRNEKQYFSTMIGMSELHDWVKLIPAKHIFFAIDACYSGIAAAHRGLDSAEPSEAVYALSRARSRLVLTAGGKNEQVAEDSDTGHGLFTQTMINALHSGMADLDMDGVITAFELATYVKSRVPDLAKRVAHMPQTPQYGSLTDGDEGEFLFLTKTLRDKLNLKK